MLDNPRRERYSQLRAAGKKPTEAYILAGFSEKGAPQSAAKLDKEHSVAERIQELRTLAAEIPSTNAWLTQNYVLNKLQEVVDKAIDAKKFGDAVSSLRLLGIHQGMFRERVDHDVILDPSSMSDQQRKVLMEFLERMEFGGDPKKIAEAKRSALLEAGVDIPPELEVVEVDSEEERG